MKISKQPKKRLLWNFLVIFFAGLVGAWIAFCFLPTTLFAQVVGGTTRTLANPLRVQQFFDSTAFFLIKTVGSVIGMIAIAVAVFAAKFGRGSFGNIAGVCLYIGLLFLAPSIVHIIAGFAGIGIAV